MAVMAVLQKPGLNTRAHELHSAAKMHILTS
jgi:hypothetical protein